ncbi:hypothetical protein CR513_22993, partial [Mucuna pruriens]
MPKAPIRSEFYLFIQEWTQLTMLTELYVQFLFCPCCDLRCKLLQCVDNIIRDLVWVHCRKERIPHLRRSKILPRGDGPFKTIKKINGNAYQVDMSQDFWGSTMVNAIGLTPCVASIEAPNLMTNSLQEGEDDAYMEEESLTLEGPTTIGRLKWIQEDLQHNLATLKDQEKTKEAIICTICRASLIIPICWLVGERGPNCEIYVGQPRSNLSRTCVLMMPSIGIR